MKIFAVVGYANTGKTTLIQKLICELRKRKQTVAVIKHCSQGFELDRPGTDSWRFMQAGSQGVALLSPQKLAVLQTRNSPADAKQIAEAYFNDSDIILIEGGKHEPGIPKIWILREGEEGLEEVDREEVVALVSEQDIDIDIPLFHPGQIQGLADFIFEYWGSHGISC
ncbi:MAG: molybdopterin-guanine dinucleotide biosynthesis protein B [Candidatus Aminicenantes bacterium]|nr:molybdopterin-guanine dinucleotide biosynthesis protein B [Candidatus Aminicenantes bacterium]